MAGFILYNIRYFIANASVLESGTLENKVLRWMLR